MHRSDICWLTHTSQVKETVTEEKLNVVSGLHKCTKTLSVQKEKEAELPTKTSGVLNETDKLASNSPQFWVYMHHVGVTNIIIEQEQSKLTRVITHNKDSW